VGNGQPNRQNSIGDQPTRENITRNIVEAKGNRSKDFANHRERKQAAKKKPHEGGKGLAKRKKKKGGAKIGNTSV